MFIAFLFCFFLGIHTNIRAEISRKTHRRMSRDLSYETHLGPKTKMEIDLICMAGIGATVPGLAFATFLNCLSILMDFNLIGILYIF